MSRIIIKNVPKVFTEKEIVEHFSKVDEITDCRIPKNNEGNSRRLAFVGFKDKTTA
jgi:multiple RNA-binding domain-containing protein 1